MSKIKTHNGYKNEMNERSVSIYKGNVNVVTEEGIVQERKSADAGSGRDGSKRLNKGHRTRRCSPTKSLTQ